MRRQISLARFASGISNSGRPCRRTLPKLVPLACWPTRPRSSSVTEHPRLTQEKSAGGSDDAAANHDHVAAMDGLGRATAVAHAHDALVE